jgi:hypothetical protein
MAARGGGQAGSVLIGTARQRCINPSVLPRRSRGGVRVGPAVVEARSRIQPLWRSQPLRSVAVAVTQVTEHGIVVGVVHDAVPELLRPSALGHRHLHLARAVRARGKATPAGSTIRRGGLARHGGQRGQAAATQASVPSTPWASIGRSPSEVRIREQPRARVGGVLIQSAIACGTRTFAALRITGTKCEGVIFINNFPIEPTDDKLRFSARNCTT